MYTPQHNKAQDKQEILEFMKAHDFAVLVTSHENKIMATHLLFLFDGDAENLTLVSHMAKANQQWKQFSNAGEVMVIFQGSHSYVSPFNYEKDLNVPTWNYIAVHAYGLVSVMESGDEKLKLLHRLVSHHDPEYFEKKFKTLPEDFIRNKMKGIVAFKIKVTRLEERFKLSQDKTDVEKQNIMNSLSSSGGNEAAGIVSAMKNLYDNDSKK